jgi:hypothetical protein
MIHAATPGGQCLAQALSGYFTSSVSILRATVTQNDVGETLSTWDFVPELAELPALIAGGDVSVRMKKQEFRTNNVTYEALYRRVLMNGAYAGIQLEDRARFGGQDWAIVSTVIDPSNAFTELLCESLEPGVI